MSEIDSFYKGIIYGIYTVARCLVYVLAFVVINVYLRQEELSLFHLLISQILLLTVSVFLLSKQALASNKRIRSLDFLLGGSFAYPERLLNIRKVAIYYSSFMLGFVFLIDGNMLFYYRNAPAWQILCIFSISFLSLAYVFRKTVSITMEDKLSEKAYYPWFFQYILVGFAAITFIYLFQKNSFSIQFSTNGSIWMLSFVLFTLTGYTIFDSLKSKLFQAFKGAQVTRKTNNSRRFSGVTQDYAEVYIRGAALWLIGPSVALRFIPIGELSKVFILLILTSFLLTPNLCSKIMLNYTKLFGKHVRYFLFRYSISILGFILLIQILLCIFSGLSLEFSAFSLIGAVILLSTRIVTAVFILESGHSDNRKMDYYGFFVMTTLFLFAFFAYYWR
ncbi:hypothetical protein [Lactovum odontotermitis]